MAPGPITGILSLLEQHGVVCLYRNLSDLGAAAFSSTTADGSTLMFLDTAASRIDLILAIAHELGHLCKIGEPSKEAEAGADAFAVSLLLPEGVLRADDKVGSSADLAATASQHGVRPRLLAQRLLALKLVTHLQFRELVHGAGALPEEQAKIPMLGSPSTIADAVRTAGGSRIAAKQAHMPTDELRRNYLSRSGPAAATLTS